MAESTVITPNFILGLGGTSWTNGQNPTKSETSGLFGAELEIDYHPVSHYSAGGGAFFLYLPGADHSKLFGLKPFFSLNMPTSEFSKNLAGVKFGFPMGARHYEEDSIRFTGGMNFEFFYNNRDPIDDGSLMWSPYYFGAGFNYFLTPAGNFLEETFLCSLKINFLGIFSGFGETP